MPELPGGADYDARFAALADDGVYLHGEADLVSSLLPTRVLDAGCGTGRVAIELASRGVDVVGADVDRSMLDQARAKAPELTWHLLDLASQPVPGPAFDLVLMAGNVLLFTRPGAEGAVIRNLAGALQPGGRLLSGFSLLPGGYDLASYDAACAAVGLERVARWATWDQDPFPAAGGTYAVSLHRLGEPAARG